MPTKIHKQILQSAAAGKLPDAIEEGSGYPVEIVKELIDGGYLSAVDVSTLSGHAYQNIIITVKGREYLSENRNLHRWAAYATIGAFVVALAAFVANWLPPSNNELTTLDSGENNRVVESKETGSLKAGVTDETPVEEISVSAPIKRSFEVSETNTDHKTIGTNVKPYIKRFSADKGYIITAYEWKESSATRVSDFVINIVDGGKVIQMDFKLKCGPKTDRYRGWLKGVLVTEQTPEDDA
jgi:hypothetical protein